MITLNTWNTLFTGKYGSQELTILYNDDYFVSFLKSRDQNDVLVQVYKVFAVIGDIEVFSETLPHQCMVFQKHYGIGSKNTYKFLILNTETEYIDSNTLSYHVDKKIQELNKLTGSIISVVKSYDLKLTSLKLISKEYRDHFFSDPTIIKVLTNMPKSAELSNITSIDKLLIGKKEGITVNSTLENLRSIVVLGSELDNRLFAVKLISEIYLLSSKTVVIFDDSGVFKSLSYPQQYEDILQKYDPTLGAFGFPSKFFEYFKNIKIPLGTVSKNAFNYIFKLVDISEKIINKVYNKDLLNIDQLINKIKEIKVDEEITDFEKERIISKLLLINKKYKHYFGKTNIEKIFDNKYKHLGSSKIIKIDKEDPFYYFYIFSIIKEISLNVTDDVLVVFPESSNLFNNTFIGSEIISILKENIKVNFIFSTEYNTDIKNIDFADVKITMINDNDAVIKYPNRDPLRLLLRPTLSSSNINFKS
jgi:hypothetical protein